MPNEPYFDVIVTYDNGPQDFFDLPTTKDRMRSNAAILKDVLESVEDRIEKVCKISVCLTGDISADEIPAWLLNGDGKWYFSTKENPR